MAKIFYSIAGEGRGHATRSQTIIEHLKDKHDITIYASNQSYELLEPVYRGTKVIVKHIEGLVFHYKKNNKVDYVKSIISGLNTLSRFSEIEEKVVNDFNFEKPDLVITDFEPFLPRIANKYDIPFISVDHQQFLCTYDLSKTPFKLRMYAAIMSQFVKLFHKGAKKTIVSSFYFPPLKKSVADTTHQIGVLLRPEILNATISNDGFYLAYLRRSVPSSVMEALENSGLPVKIYGLGERETRGNVEFKKIDNKAFVEDLSNCKALISTSGNQLVGEALYLKKPILAMPEKGNQEQHLNGYFLESSGQGMVVDIESLTVELLKEFENKFEYFFENIYRDKLCGNFECFRHIEESLVESVETSRRTQGVLVANLGST